jgi:hypothetical protein
LAVRLRRLGLADTIEGGRDAPLRGDHVGAALEHLQRHADRNGSGQRRERFGRLQLRGRMTPEE